MSEAKIESLPSYIGPKVSKAHLTTAIIVDRHSLNSLGYGNPVSASRAVPIVKEMRLFKDGNGIMLLSAEGTIKVVEHSVIDTYELEELPAAPQKIIEEMRRFPPPPKVSELTPEQSANIIAATEEAMKRSRNGQPR